MDIMLNFRRNSVWNSRCSVKCDVEGRLDMSERCQYLLPLCLVEGVGKTTTKFPQNLTKKEFFWDKTFIYVRRFYSFKVLFFTSPYHQAIWEVSGPWLADRTMLAIMRGNCIKNYHYSNWELFAFPASSQAWQSTEEEEDVLVLEKPCWLVSVSAGFNGYWTQIIHISRMF